MKPTGVGATFFSQRYTQFVTVLFMFHSLFLIFHSNIVCNINIKQNKQHNAIFHIKCRV